MRILQLFGILTFVLLASTAWAGPDDLAWLAGSWRGGNERETWESVFTTDSGGVILGTYKQAAREGKLSFVELQQIDLRSSPATLILVANGGTPYKLTATRLTPQLAEFTGDHPFPRVVLFTRDADARHTLTLTGTLKEKPFVEKFPFERVP